MPNAAQSSTRGSHACMHLTPALPDGSSQGHARQVWYPSLQLFIDAACPQPPATADDEDSKGGLKETLDKVGAHADMLMRCAVSPRAF